MGKTSRRHRLRHWLKPNPVADGYIFEEELSVRNIGLICAIQKQLQNANVEEKINGLQSLAVLASNNSMVTALISSRDDDELLRIAAPLLCDKNVSVRNAAAGAIRNLSVCGPEVCEYIVEKDVLTPLTVLLHEYATDPAWTPTFDSPIEGQIDIRSDVFLQAINLLRNLCESSSNALDIFNQSHLLDAIIRCLDFKVFGLDIALSVAQCLLVVTESNPIVWHIIIKHTSIFLYLLRLTGEYEQIYLRTISAGILSNVPAIGGVYTIQILKSISQTLDVDHFSCLNTLNKVSLDQDINTAIMDSEVNMEVNEDETYEEGVRRRRRQELPTRIDIMKEKCGYLLEALRISMEIITNLCETEDEDYIGSEEEMSDCESILDGINVNECVANKSEGEHLPLELIASIKSLDLIGMIWQKAQPLPESLAQFLSGISKTLYSKTQSLRISSLICLQNFCNSLRSEDLGGPTDIYNVWVELGKQVFKVPYDLSLLEPATSVMRSALVHLKSNKDLFQNMTNNDLELILDGIKNCAVAEARANWLRMLGTLGCLLPEHLIKIIVVFIVETCGKENDAWTLSEALDSLMDIFSDNDWNQLVIDLGLCKLTKGLDSIFKTKIREQTRELSERYAAVKTVRVNFTRFVSYIEDQKLQYKNSK